jgi:hypothetical protein
MTLAEFKSTLGQAAPPTDLSFQLEALWHDGAGNWERSHEVVQDMNGPDAAWIHAYLHRKEGDISNAKYWYSRANKSLPSLSLTDEWQTLVLHFLRS